MTQRKRSSGTFSSSGSTFGSISRQRSAKGYAVLGTWRGLALLWQRGGSTGTESRAPCQLPLRLCASSHGIRRGQCSGLHWMVLSFLSWLMVRPRIPDTCAVKSQRQSTSSCGHGRRGHRLLTVSGSAAKTRRQIFSWLVSRELYGLRSDSTIAHAAAKPHSTQPACVVKRAARRLSCTDIGCVLEICLIIPMRRRSRHTNDYPAEHRQRQRTHPACGSEAFSQPSILQGCCHRQPLKRRQWSLEQEVLPRQATSFETTRCTGTQTAAAGNTAMMPDLSELVGAQWVSRAKCLSLSVRRHGVLYMGRFLENCRALTVQKLGLTVSCWNVLWAIWSLVRIAITWLSAFTDAGGLVKAASRMATCGVESVLHSIASVRSLSIRSGRTYWLLTLLLIWQVTRGQASWAMNLLTLLLRKVPFSMRFQWTWSQPSARQTLLQSAYRSSSVPRPFRPFPN